MTTYSINNEYSLEPFHDPIIGEYFSVIRNGAEHGFNPLTSITIQMVVGKLDGCHDRFDLSYNTSQFCSMEELYNKIYFLNYYMGMGFRNHISNNYCVPRFKKHNNIDDAKLLIQTLDFDNKFICIDINEIVMVFESYEDMMEYEYINDAVLYLCPIGYNCFIPIYEYDDIKNLKRLYISYSYPIHIDKYGDILYSDINHRVDNKDMIMKELVSLKSNLFGILLSISNRADKLVDDYITNNIDYDYISEAISMNDIYTVENHSILIMNGKKYIEPFTEILEKSDTETITLNI